MTLRSSIITLFLLLASGAQAQSTVPEATPMGLLAGRELLAEVLDALGGEEAWEAVKAYASEGTTGMSSMVGEVSIQSASVVRGTGEIRVEQSTPVGDALILVRGETVTLEVEGRRQIPSPEASGVRAQLLFSVPYVLAHRETLSMNRIADRPGGLPVLRFRAPGVEPLYDLILSTDRRPLRIESIQASAMGPGYFAYSFSDYREIGGLQIPFRTEQRVDDMLLTTSILTRFTANPEIPAGAFGG